jgi:adenylosuccinate synthase
LREARKVHEDDDFLKTVMRYTHAGEIQPILEDSSKNILVEGTQGFGLSLNFSGHYPFTTSVDLTSYQILAECGVPFGVHKVMPVLVFRTFLVRVPNPQNGSSGHLAYELTWEKVSEICGHPVKVEYDCRPPIWEEKVPRRIGMFEDEMAQKAVWHCQPSLVVLTHLDWYFPNLAETGLTFEANKKVYDYEQAIGHAIGLVGVGEGKFLPTQALIAQYGDFLVGLV